MGNSHNTSNILHHHQNTTEIITPFLKPLYENLGIDSLSYIGFKENRIYVYDTNTPWVERVSFIACTIMKNKLHGFVIKKAM